MSIPIGVKEHTLCSLLFISNPFSDIFILELMQIIKFIVYLECTEK